METLDFESLEGLDDLIASLRKARGEQGQPWDGEGFDDDDDEDAYVDLEYDDDSDEVDAELQMVPVTPDSQRNLPTSDAKPYKKPITASKALVPVQGEVERACVCSNLFVCLM